MWLVYFFALIWKCYSSSSGPPDQSGNSSPWRPPNIPRLPIPRSPGSSRSSESLTTSPLLRATIRGLQERSRPTSPRTPNPNSPGSTTPIRPPSPLTPCQMELRSGRYIARIAGQFPPMSNGQPSVTWRAAAKNIFCQCHTGTRMVCHIICTSPEMERIALARIDRRNPSRLRPFFVNPLLTDATNSVLYVHEDASPVVIAEVIVFPERASPSIANFIRPMTLANSDHFDNTPATPSELVSSPVGPARDPLEDTFLSSFSDRIRLPPSLTQVPNLPREYPPLEPNQRPRSVPMPRDSAPLLTPNEGRSTEPRHDSAPMRFNYPDKYIPLYICTGGYKDVACPISLRLFEPGQTVYVLKREVPKIKQGKAVGCILAEGLMQLKNTQTSQIDGGFRDPLRRTGDTLLTIKNNYTAFVISDEENLISWVPPLADSPTIATYSSESRSMAGDLRRPPSRSQAGSSRVPSDQGSTSSQRAGPSRVNSRAASEPGSQQAGSPQDENDASADEQKVSASRKATSRILFIPLILFLFISIFTRTKKSAVYVDASVSLL